MVTNDVKLLKQYIKAQQVDQIANIISQLKNSVLLQDALSQSMKRMASKDDLEEVQKKFNEYVRYEEFKLLEEECSNMVRFIDLETLNMQVVSLERKTSKYMQTDEFIHRISTLSQEIKEQLDERPTEKAVKQSFKKLDDKINANQLQVSQRVDSVNKLQQDFEGELQLYNAELEKVHKCYNHTLTRDDGKKIWRHF